MSINMQVRIIIVQQSKFKHKYITNILVIHGKSSLCSVDYTAPTSRFLFVRRRHKYRLFPRSRPPQLGSVTCWYLTKITHKHEKMQWQ